MAPRVQLRRLTRRDDCTTSGRPLAGWAGRAVQPPLDGVFAFLPFRAAATGAWWQWTATRELDTRQRRAGRSCSRLQPYLLRGTGRDGAGIRAPMAFMNAARPPTRVPNRLVGIAAPFVAVGNVALPLPGQGPAR